ncbi:MAG: ribose transport system permease protein, partial [Gaiellaceae bacterium]|nr:ribose transport system permease protein [Gaiellaceae bacterium]
MIEPTDAQVKRRRGARRRVSRGLATVSVATAALFAVSALAAPSSTSKGTLLSMLPFAAVLVIVALGQTLVVQQGGIDLSVPGAMSLALVICTHYPAGDNSKLLPALLISFVVAIAAGLGNGFLIGVLELNPIVATLGTNALLYGAVLGVSGGTPRQTTERLADITSGLTFGIPNAVYFAVVAVAIVTVLVKLTPAGRRFEGVGANSLAALTSGLRVKRQRASAYVWAQILYWLGAVLLAGILTQPTAFQGDSYLLPSVAAVVLGGTSLLGGRG